MTDSIGRTASFLVEIIEPGGRVTRIDRRSDRKITRIGDESRASQLSYGANNLVSEIRDLGNRSLSFSYNGNRRIESITDADGGQTRYDYEGDD
jgi:YD repeat-containing protein